MLCSYLLFQLPTLFLCTHTGLGGGRGRKAYVPHFGSGRAILLACFRFSWRAPFRLAHDFRHHTTLCLHDTFDTAFLTTHHTPHHRQARSPRGRPLRGPILLLLRFLFLLLSSTVFASAKHSSFSLHYSTSHATTISTTSHHKTSSPSPALDCPLLPLPAVRAAFPRTRLQPYGRRQPSLSRDPPRRDEPAFPFCC